MDRGNFPVISVKKLSKYFELTEDRGGVSLKNKFIEYFKQIGSSINATYKNGLLNQAENSTRLLKVLKSVDFEIVKGETVALLGSNGSGKSTLLKILAGIYQPTSGVVEIGGRVSPLIELGAGFHPEFSGRDNIYINATILGLSKSEIEERIQDIIAFSELGDFIDCPVRTYSSGMYMRLGFSISVHVDPSILLIDEVLAVGDMNFQAKCQQKLDEFKSKGITIVLVTHNLEIVKSWTNRAIYLRSGEIIYDGESSVAVQRYSDFERSKATYAGTESYSNALQLNYSKIDLNSDLYRNSSNLYSLQNVNCLQDVRIERIEVVSHEIVLSFCILNTSLVQNLDLLELKVFNQDKNTILFSAKTTLGKCDQGRKYCVSISKIAALGSGEFILELVGASGTDAELIIVMGRLRVYRDKPESHIVNLSFGVNAC